MLSAEATRRLRGHGVDPTKILLALQGGECQAPGYVRFSHNISLCFDFLAEQGVYGGGKLCHRCVVTASGAPLNLRSSPLACSGDPYLEWRCASRSALFIPQRIRDSWETNMFANIQPVPNGRARTPAARNESLPSAKDTPDGILISNESQRVTRGR